MVAVLAGFCCLSGLAVAPATLAAVLTDAILVLDNSSSMRKNDPDFLAKRAVSKFVSDLDQETRVGILIFDEKVKYSVPLTELTVNTRAAIQPALDDIDYRGEFTDSPAAIERAIYELKANARDDVVKVIIFMTDGIVDTGNPEVDGEKAKWMREELAADAADSGIKVFSIAFTENADFFLIQSLAKKTDGAYFRALTPEDLAGVFAKVNEILEAPPPVPAPAPIATAGPAALGQCIASLVPDERAAFEQMAAEAGITAEQLCGEMMLAPEGTAVIIPADQAVSEDDVLGMILVVGLAALVLLGIVVLVVVLIRKRRGIAGVPASQQPEPEADIFDDEAETAPSARHRYAQAAEVEPGEIDSEAKTALGGGEPSDAEQGPEFVTAAPSYDEDKPSDDAFDAEASAFFGEDSLVPVSEDDENMTGFEDVDGPAPVTEPVIGGGDEAEFSELETLLPASLSGDEDEDEFREAETLLPESLTGDENQTLEATSDISLDEFMRTDSFETPLVDFDETDSEDATSMPEQVPEAPEIEDVFDIRGEGVLPPVKSDDAEDDDSPDDDAEGLTVFGS